MDFTDSKEEMCKKYLLMSIPSTTTENIKTENIKNHKSNLSDMSIEYLENSDPKEPILSSTNYTKSGTYTVDNNSTLQWNKCMFIIYIDNIIIFYKLI